MSATKIKIKLNLNEYRNKVYACWVGKNIGGTMGAPYEGTREKLDIKGYKTEANVVLPNDDLDLQLIWLHALENEGASRINAETLGEMWLSFIVPHWNEYGIGKENMIRGMLPPLAGDYENDWKDSNGAWIRTEIWACTAPGCPDIAAKYAVYDATVDHGAGEGTYAAAFVAAMQSAAFVINNLRECIEIGLSVIPEKSRMADSVRFIMECYDKKIPAMEARDLIQARNADIGNGWFEAPSNVAYAILGLLYGEGDFKKTMITAINCGDDTDCTAATVGATLGILGGKEIIPADWQKHIGDDIVTLSINRGSVGRGIPQTCTELAERVIAQASAMLTANRACVQITAGESEITEEGIALVKAANTATTSDYVLLKNKICELSPYTIEKETTFISVKAILDRAPDIKPGESIGIKVKVYNKFQTYDNKNYNLEFRWWLPEGFTVSGPKSAILHHATRHNEYIASDEYCFIITAGEAVSADNKAVLEISSKGRITDTYVPILLLG